jgi:hypothetical protein
MWLCVEEPWQYRVLDELPAGVDRAQLERAAALSPTERVEAVVRLMEIAERLQQSLHKREAGA